MKTVKLIIVVLSLLFFISLASADGVTKNKKFATNNNAPNNHRASSTNNFGAGNHDGNDFDADDDDVDVDDEDSPHDDLDEGFAANSKPKFGAGRNFDKTNHHHGPQAPQGNHHHNTQDFDYDDEEEGDYQHDDESTHHDEGDMGDFYHDDYDGDFDGPHHDCSGNMGDYQQFPQQGRHPWGRHPWWWWCCRRPSCQWAWWCRYPCCFGYYVHQNHDNFGGMSMMMPGMDGNEFGHPQSHHPWWWCRYYSCRCPWWWCRPSCNRPVYPCDGDYVHENHGIAGGPGGDWWVNNDFHGDFEGGYDE